MSKQNKLSEEIIQKLAELFQCSPFTYTIGYNFCKAADGETKCSYFTKTRTKEDPEFDWPALFESHLTGKDYLVLKPVLPDSTVWFACIDLDTYQHGDDYEKVVKRIEDLRLPLNCFPSKNRGLHAFLFSEQPQDVHKVRKQLMLWAAEIGYPGIEVFPKQNVTDPTNWGNGIALPFFGDREHVKIIDFTPVRFTVPASIDTAATSNNGNGVPARQAAPSATGDKIPRGTINNWLVSTAGNYRRRGDDEEMIFGKLKIDYVNRCEGAVLGKNVTAKLKRIAKSVCRHEPSSDLILSPGDPLPSAREFVAQEYTAENGTAMLVHQGEVFYEWQRDANVYAEIDVGKMREELYSFLEQASCWGKPKKKDENDEPELVPFKPTKPKVANVLDALRAVTNLPISTAAPAWLEIERDSELNPLDVLPCRNGLLHIPTRELLDPTPDFFALNCADFAYDPKAPQPENWLAFLQQLWPNNNDRSAATLQEFLGYLLTPRTHLEKIGLIIGPKRSGKGTIGKVARALCGSRNSCAPTLAALGDQFGVAVLIGKTLAVVSDARVGSRTDTAAVIERLLSISGQDYQTIQRKFLPDWNGKLSTRFLMLANALPWLEDPGGAFVSRFVMMVLTKSFLGKEDPRLFDKLEPELPGILNWALAGYDRLYERGYFLQPKNSAELVKHFEELSSPITAFLDERCETKPGYQIRCEELYRAWKDWCDTNGRENPGASNVFARNLHAAMPWLKTKRDRTLKSAPRSWQGIRIKS
jgi:putative DNA primase/helicase